MPRPALSRILLLFLGLAAFAIISSWEHTLGDAASGSLTVPVAIQLAGLSAADQDRLLVTFLGPREPVPGEIPSDADEQAVSQGVFSWKIPFRAIRQLHITARPDVLKRIQSVVLDIGGSRDSFDAGRFMTEWRAIDPFAGVLEGSNGSEITLAWPATRDHFINERSHPDLLKALVTRAGMTAIVCWALCLAMITLLGRRQNSSVDRAAFPQRESAAAWLAAGFAVFCVGIAFAKSREPYALTQDDNFSQFLPVILRSAQDLFAGRFPVWNPHQWMGAPTATVGTYMLTYPPTYLSYWIARSIFGDPYLTIEVFIILHLAAGYLLTFWLLRRFGLRPSLAAAGGLSFTLCAFLLIGGRSQVTFVPVAVWLPLFVACVLRLKEGPAGWKWALATGAVIGIYFHAGHAQYWTYSLMFSGIAVLLLTAGVQVPWQRALWFIPALGFGVALAAPLLLPQMMEARGRHFGSEGTGVNLLGMLVPLGNLAPDVRQLFNEPEWSGQIPYFGTTFAVAGFIGLGCYLYLLVLCKIKRPEWRVRLGEATWLLLMLFAVVLALGPDGILWPLMAQFPPFSDFRWPNKLLPFVALFACVGGGIELERCCSRWRPSRACWLAAVTMGLVLLNTWWSRAGIYHYGDRPYPRLDAAYQRLIFPPSGVPTARILPRPDWLARSPAPGYFGTQDLNFPTVTGALAVGGYDTFVENSETGKLLLKRLYRDPIPAARAYGVRWVIWDDLYSHPVFSPSPLMDRWEMISMPERRAMLIIMAGAVPVFRKDGAEVYQTGAADPLAFVDGPEKKELRVSFDMRGATVETAVVPAGASVVVNVLARPWMKAFADGAAVPSGRDSWGRVVVPLASPARRLEVLYRPPWAMSSLAGLGIAILALALGWLLPKK